MHRSLNQHHNIIPALITGYVTWVGVATSYISENGGVLLEWVYFSSLRLLCPPNQRGGGHIVFGADPVGISVGVCVRVASFPHIIF